MFCLSVIARVENYIFDELKSSGVALCSYVVALLGYNRAGLKFGLRLLLFGASVL